MIAVKEGDVFIMKHHDRDDASKSFYLIENVWDQELCDVLVITFWRYTIPTMYFMSGYVSDILEPPARGSREQGTSEDWFKALQSMFVQVREYSKKVIEEAKDTHIAVIDSDHSARIFNLDNKKDVNVMTDEEVSN